MIYILYYELLISTLYVIIILINLVSFLKTRYSMNNIDYFYMVFSILVYCLLYLLLSYSLIYLIIILIDY